jgi:hypothetical protein
MQNVLHWSPIQAGAAYLPVTVFLGLAATISPMIFARVGTLGARSPGLIRVAQLPHRRS